MMDVYSLSGTSGTGKSTSALSFAYKKKIPTIIDDGLLILNGQKIAGTSAKFEKNYITAVKRATFFDEQHRMEVHHAIRYYSIGRILIIGTSDRMVQLIAKRLEIGEIKQYYHIEDIRSSSEIKIAQYVRKTEGKHTIPIPYKEVDQNFFKKLIHKGMIFFSSQKEVIGETTIVRPDFHRGSIKIYKKVFKEMVEYICFNYEEIENCELIIIDLQELPTLKLSLNLRYPIQYNLLKKIETLQKDIQQQFINHLNMELQSINITVNKAKKKGRSSK